MVHMKNTVAITVVAVEGHEVFSQRAQAHNMTTLSRICKDLFKTLQVKLISTENDNKRPLRLHFSSYVVHAVFPHCSTCRTFKPHFNQSDSGREGV